MPVISSNTSKAAKLERLPRHGTFWNCGVQILGISPMRMCDSKLMRLNIEKRREVGQVMHACMYADQAYDCSTHSRTCPYPGRTVYMVQLKPAGERKYFISLSFFHFIFHNFELLFVEKRLSVHRCNYIRARRPGL